MCALRCYRLVMPCPPAVQSPLNATPSPESTGAITTTRARELLDPPPRAARARPSGRPTPAPPAPKGVPSIRSIRSSASDHRAFQLAHQLLACVCLGRVCARHASSSLGRGSQGNLGGQSHELRTRARRILMTCSRGPVSCRTGGCVARSSANGDGVRQGKEKKKGKWKVS